MSNLKRPPFENLDPGDFSNLDSDFDVFEVKADGWSVSIAILGNYWNMYSRTERWLDGGVLKGEYLNTSLRGEYLFGTQRSKSHSRYGQVALFDAIHVDGADLLSYPLAHRRYLIAAFLRSIEQEDLRKKLFLVKQYPISLAAEKWDEFVVHGGEEGLVLKNSTSTWGERFGRMKKRVTMDYVVLGFDESDSDTYAGWGVKSINGGLFVNGELRRVCRVSGLTAEWRAEFFSNPEKHIGRVFEAEGKQLMKSGALRHPNFVRFRDDKRPEECVL